MRGNQKQRWTSLLSPWTPNFSSFPFSLSLPFPFSPRALLSLMFASFSRFLSNWSCPLLTFSPCLPLTSHSLRDKGVEESLAEVGWSYRWKFSRLAISVQSASHPSVCTLVSLYIRGGTSRKCGVELNSD